MHFAAVLYLYAYMRIIANATLLIKQTGVIRFAVLEGLMCDVINSCSMCSKHRRATEELVTPDSLWSCCRGRVVPRQPLSDPASRDT